MRQIGKLTSTARESSWHTWNLAFRAKDTVHGAQAEVEEDWQSHILKPCWVILEY